MNDSNPKGKKNPRLANTRLSPPPDPGPSNRLLCVHIVFFFFPAPVVRRGSAPKKCASVLLIMY